MTKLDLHEGGEERPGNWPFVNACPAAPPARPPWPIPIPALSSVASLARLAPPREVSRP
jgi:hypothetical protein